MPTQKTQHFHTTALFQRWLTKYNLVWPDNDPHEQELLIAQFWYEGMLLAAADPETWIADTRIADTRIADTRIVTTLGE